MIIDKKCKRFLFVEKVNEDHKKLLPIAWIG